MSHFRREHFCNLRTCLRQESGTAIEAFVVEHALWPLPGVFDCRLLNALAVRDQEEVLLK